MFLQNENICETFETINPALHITGHNVIYDATTYTALYVVPRDIDMLRCHNNHLSIMEEWFFAWNKP